ncbi:hypothetical protein [Streptomyces sp. NBC_01500]|uniref:hypothetical protein n=1 Tax=Streptomyces sp. NBC_01500 TaxID=2903886 RepID=UPI00225A6CB1|nr:hypothetical protein [Streptomyces sp. NBC_01500]MCX4548549.1 hypothetical protein [Streptomyces sp. NBC_01500]
MEDDEIIALFDGRGCADFTLTGGDVAQSDKIGAIGFELGYDLGESVCVTRGQWRMVYVRNDSPEVRQRAHATVARLRAGGPLLPGTWGAPGPLDAAGRPISAVEVASARRSVGAYEANGAKGFVVFAALISLACLVIAWLQRDTSATAYPLMVVGVFFAVTAAFIPRWLRRWYERNREMVSRFEQGRILRGDVPPPPPPPLAGGTWGPERDDQ